MKNRKIFEQNNAKNVCRHPVASYLMLVLYPFTKESSNSKRSKKKGM